MNAVELHMDVMYAVFSGHEPNAVLFTVNILNEAIINVSRWTFDLKKQIEVYKP